MRDPYKLVHEKHGCPEEIDLTPLIGALTMAGITFIATSSRGDLSKYTKPGEKRRRGSAIYVQEKSPELIGARAPVQLLEDCTDLFVKYEAQRQIGRLYVPREEMTQAREVITETLRQG